MKRIAFTSAAARQLRKAPADIRERIIARIERYAATQAGDVKALTGRAGARLRIGDWRVIFVETDTEISVREIAARKDIY